MIKLKGKYNSARVYADDIEITATEQIETMLSHKAFGKTRIAVMPDVHAGKGSVVGFTMKLRNNIIPNVIGSDIGCGVTAYRLPIDGVDGEMLQRLDDAIRGHVPHGFEVHDDIWATSSAVIRRHYPSSAEQIRLDRLPGLLGYDGHECVIKQLGTLGGGNHFLSVDTNASGEYWLVIHTGSRNFGYRIAAYHQKKAVEACKSFGVDTPEDLAFLPMEFGGKEYLDDMQVAQKFASLNRDTIAKIIFKQWLGADFKRGSGVIESVHNYIDFDDGIIRKGAIRSHAGERLIIPINMAFGCIVGTGKSNELWNNSAPHGAGRLMSRGKARATLDIDTAKQQMDGIFTTSLRQETIDEAPNAYKDPQTILDAIKDTVDVDFILKPVYNFKSDHPKKKWK